MCYVHKSFDSVLGSRTRRLLQRSKPGVQGTAKVLSMLHKVKEEEPEMETGAEPGEEGTIVLDTIAEFCRQVGEKEQSEREGQLCSYNVWGYKYLRM